MAKVPRQGRCRVRRDQETKRGNGKINKVKRKGKDSIDDVDLLELKLITEPNDGRFEVRPPSLDETVITASQGTTRILEVSKGFLAITDRKPTVAGLADPRGTQPRTNGKGDPERRGPADQHP